MALNSELLPDKRTFSGQILPGPPGWNPPATRIYGCLDETLKYKFSGKQSRNEIIRKQERDMWANQDIGLPQLIDSKDDYLTQEAKYWLLTDVQRLEVEGPRMPLRYGPVSFLFHLILLICFSLMPSPNFLMNVIL